MKNYFEDIVRTIKNTLKPGENFTSWFSAESLDYARFNKAKIRQAGTACQQFINIDLIVGRKHATSCIGLSRDLKSDEIRIKESLKLLRGQIEHSEDDPYLMINEKPTSSESIFAHKLLPKEEVVDDILRVSNGLDLVGYYFGGPIFKGFASSFGQTNWFEKSSFVIDTSVYHSGDKAIKQCYADDTYKQATFAEKMEHARSGLKLFGQESKAISPGEYRVYFAPSAVNEILSLINWGGFSRKSLEVKDSPLLKLHKKEKFLSSAFSLSENTEQGVGPNFQSQGYMKPGLIPLIEQGRLKNTLISPKTAKEYKLDHNGADESESLCSIEMSAGDMPNREILETLGDGLYINNLWYLNFSDKQNGFLTGMTRFFCYVVKNKKAVSPFSVMRFDDSIYRIFGENLRHITKERELIIDNSTYDERSTSCSLVPGIIAENVRLTL